MWGELDTAWVAAALEMALWARGESKPVAILCPSPRCQTLSSWKALCCLSKEDHLPPVHGSMLAGNHSGPALGELHTWKGLGSVLEKPETGQKILNRSSGVSFTAD